jgi:glycosyltransferase involved in cell wall biosynthesis
MSLRSQTLPASGRASSARPLRVALASVGDPESPRTWSGVTSGLLRALRDLGVAATAVDLALPRGLEQALLAAGAASTRNRFDAHSAAMTMGARGLLARRRAPAGEFDGVIQIGSGFILPAGTSYVTLEDMTLRQGGATHPVFSRMSAPAVASWERRRAIVYRRARMCAAASHWTRASLLADYGLPADRVAVVGFGANHMAAPSERAWQPPRFLFVGVDWERKGGPLLLSAFARLREAIPEATLDLVGGHPPVQQPGVNAHGELSQSRDDDRRLLAELFGHATCLAVPSLIEPFGIVYVEAGSSGIPSIVSGQGGAADIVGADGGIVVAPGDEQGLLQAMLRLSDPGVARPMGRAAHERAALYTWTRVAERLLRALGLSLPDGRPLAEFL